MRILKMCGSNLRSAEFGLFKGEVIKYNFGYDIDKCFPRSWDVKTFSIFWLTKRD